MRSLPNSPTQALRDMSYLLRQRIRSQLELHDLGLCSLAAFHMKGRSAAEGRPQSPALPAFFRIVYAPVHAFDVEAHGVGHAKRNEFPVYQSKESVVQI